LNAFTTYILQLYFTMMQSYVGISASTLANNLPTAAGADPTFLDD